MNTAQAPRSSSRRLWLGAAALVAALGATTFVAFAAETVKGNGQLRKQDRPVAGLTGIELALPAELEVRQGAVDSITIETDENLLPLIKTEVDNGTLKIQPVRKKLNLSSRHLKIVVTARDIRELGISGTGSIRADRLKTAKLTLEIAGSGTIAVRQVEADHLETGIAGSGTIDVAGAARRIEVEIAGSGDVKAAQLKADDAEVSIAGSGDAVLWAVNAIKVEIAGSGDVQYWGDPKTVQTSVAGSGRLRRLGAAPQ